MVYTSKLERHLPGLYDLILQKSYPTNKNIRKPVLVMLYLRKFISTFHYDYAEKPTATFLPIDPVLLMAKLIIKPRAKTSSIKQKDGQLKIKYNSKYTKKN